MPKLDSWVKHYRLEKCIIPKFEIVTQFMCVVLMHLWKFQVTFPNSQD